jgi:redox-sensing transcriptional repressor
VAVPEKRPAPPDQVSELTTARLSVYLRALDQLAAVGVSTVSSSGLADRFGFNAALIRKDLACFGEFGVRGVGYDVAGLRTHLRHILGLDRGLRLVIIGAGNLGLALADYPGFAADGFSVVGLFDVAPDKVGTSSRGGILIRHVDDLGAVADREQVDIAVVAVPSPAAQATVDHAVAAGIRAILNFSPGTVRVAPGVKLKSVDVTLSLEGLSFFLASERHAADPE